MRQDDKALALLRALCEFFACFAVKGFYREDREEIHKDRRVADDCL